MPSPCNLYTSADTYTKDEEDGNTGEIHVLIAHSFRSTPIDRPRQHSKFDNLDTEDQDPQSSKLESDCLKEGVHQWHTF